MLINFSNHPENNWSNSQLTLAEKEFGKIVDLKFPQIDPEWDETEVKNFAKEYYEIIKSMIDESNDKVNAVHIMGELTFTFAVVDLLLEANIRCIASTTERKTVEIGNKKISEFKFVRFRNYIKRVQNGK